MIDKERGEIPTASAAERNTYCPGSHNLCLIAPPSDNLTDPGRGILLHELLSQSGDINFDGFDDSEQWLIEQCVYIKQSIQAHFNFDHAKVHVEERLFFIGPKKEPLFSARLDLFAVDEENCSALIIDYKTGWKGAAEAERNLQLRWQAALVYKNYNVTKIYVAIVQPMVSEMPYSVAFYDDAKLIRAIKAISRVVSDLQAPDAPRVPGPVQCEWCRAKSICPEAHLVVKRLPSFDFKHLKGSQAMTFLDACSTASKIIDGSKHYFADVLSKDETAFPGYKTMTRKLPYILAEDNLEVFNIFKRWIDGKTFTQLVKLTPTQIINYIYDNSKWSKKRVKEFVEEKLGSILKHNESDPFLTVVMAKTDRKKLALEYDHQTEET
jgi:CRISPR/Cas system-associated exonuclease Cas4 (RecB family)